MYIGRGREELTRALTSFHCTNDMFISFYKTPLVVQR